MAGGPQISPHGDATPSHAPVSAHHAWRAMQRSGEGSDFAATTLTASAHGLNPCGVPHWSRAVSRRAGQSSAHADVVEEATSVG